MERERPTWTVRGLHNLGKCQPRVWPAPGPVHLSSLPHQAGVGGGVGGWQANTWNLLQNPGPGGVWGLGLPPPGQEGSVGPGGGGWSGCQGCFPPGPLTPSHINPGSPGPAQAWRKTRKSALTAQRWGQGDREGGGGASPSAWLPRCHPVVTHTLLASAQAWAMARPHSSPGPWPSRFSAGFLGALRCSRSQ